MLNIYLAISFLVTLAGVATGASCPSIVTRDEWGSTGLLIPFQTTRPASYVILHHTKTPRCTIRRDCENTLKNLQRSLTNYGVHIDVGYNFLIGDDGNIYEGVGWERSTRNILPGETTVHIGLIGDYNKAALPDKRMLDIVERLVECGINIGAIRRDHKRRY